MTRSFMNRNCIVRYVMCSSKFHKIIWSVWFISFFIIRTLQWNPMNWLVFWYCIRKQWHQNRDCQVVNSVVLGSRVLLTCFTMMDYNRFYNRETLLDQVHFYNDQTIVVRSQNSIIGWIWCFMRFHRLNVLNLRLCFIFERW